MIADYFKMPVVQSLLKNTTLDPDAPNHFHPREKERRKS